MISDIGVKREKKVSISESNDFDIEPVTYSFREPKKIRTSLITTAARPPYWLYHDHALGVIWMIFHKNKNYVGISQLQWCLKFLLDLKNSQGEYTGDVDLCIQTIQDILIERYSKLGKFLNNIVDDKSSKRKKLSKNPSEAINAILVAESEEKNEQFTSNNNETENAIIKQENLSNIQNESESIKETEKEQNFFQEHFSSMHEHEIQGSSTPNEEIRVSKSGKKIEDNFDEPCSSRCGNSSKEKSKNKDIMSITYKEMIARGSEPCAKEYFTKDIYDESFYIEEQLENTASKLINDKNSMGKQLQELNASELSDFLNSSRKQHLVMIKNEINRLHGLEKLRKNIDTDGFTSYVTEEIARRLENLQDDDIVNAAEEIFKKFLGN